MHNIDCNDTGITRKEFLFLIFGIVFVFFASSFWVKYLPINGQKSHSFKFWWGYGNGAYGKIDFS